VDDEDGAGGTSRDVPQIGDIPRVHVRRTADIAVALDQLAVRRGIPVLVLVGGAAGMTQAHLATLSSVLRQSALPLLDRLGAAVVDGATDSGVMRVVGQARREGQARFPLVGVAAEGTVNVPGEGSAGPNAADLEPHHTQFILVPGADWGDESPWLADVADEIASGAPSVTLVVNGGEITFDDVAASLARGRPVLVLAGTGRTADAIARARTQSDGDPRAAALASSELTSVVAVDDADGVRMALEAALARS
jgi:hypothetical protein